MNKMILAGSAVAFLLAAGMAFAQTGTSYPTTGTTGAATGASARTGTSTTNPGVPNTGAGGNASDNAAVLGAAAVVGLAATGALMMKRKAV